MKMISPLFTWRSALTTDPELHATARHVALVVSLYMSERGDNAFPSVQRIAADCARGKSAVVEGLQVLEKRGWLHVDRAPGKRGGRGRTNSYIATFPEHVELPRNGPVAGKAPHETVLSPTVPEAENGPVSAINGPVAEENGPVSPVNGPEAGRLPRHTTPTPRQDIDAATPSPALRSSDPIFELLFLAETGAEYTPGVAISPALRNRINAARSQAKQGELGLEELREAMRGWPGAMGDSRITANALVINAPRCINAARGVSFVAPGTRGGGITDDEAMDALRRLREKKAVRL